MPVCPVTLYTHAREIMKFPLRLTQYFRIAVSDGAYQVPLGGRFGLPVDIHHFISCVRVEDAYRLGLSCCSAMTEI
jgi:hypothetical protein